MARKKKIKEQSTEASVKYTGQVTIEKIRANKVVGRKVIKNTGCMPLFKFFADCLTLATDENAEQVGLFNSKPQYLNCFYKDSTDALSFETFGQSQVRSYMKQTGTQRRAPGTGQDTAKQMKMMNYFMVVMFFIFSLQNTALALYWLIGGIYQLLQSFVGRKMNEKHYYKLTGTIPVKVKEKN